jgi:hypothetical protein
MQESALAPHVHEIFRLEFVQMVRQGGIWNIQLLLNLSDDETVRMGRQQQLHDPQTWLRSHRGEHIRVLNQFLAGFLRLSYRHISMFAEIWLDCQVQSYRDKLSTRASIGWRARASTRLVGRTWDDCTCFDGFAEKLTDSYHVYGITRRGYGASSRPEAGYTEQRRAEDDLRVFDALGLVVPVVAGHSVAGNVLSELGIHHYERIAGLVYLEALNDGTDNYTDYDAVSSKLPEVMRTPLTPSPTDLQSFQTDRDWRSRTDGISIPGAELRNEFAENPDGTVGRL